MTSEVIAFMTSQPQLGGMTNPRLLRRALYANALFSTLCALLLLMDGSLLAPAFGLSSTLPLTVVGIGLLPFAAFVAVVARAKPIDGRLVASISLSDFFWVVASGVVVGLVPLSPIGLSAVAGVAAVVALFGVLQLEGLRRTFRNEGEGPRIVLGGERKVAASPAAVWAVVSDIEAYHRYADNLSFSRVLSGEGIGLVRECGDHEGGRWTERCTRWEPGEGYTFVVCTDADDYPYPFVALEGDWSIAEVAGGTKIVLRFRTTLPGGWFGDVLAAALLAPRFQPVIDGLLDAWTEQIIGTKSAYHENAEDGWAPRPSAG